MCKSGFASIRLLFGEKNQQNLRRNIVFKVFLCFCVFVGVALGMDAEG